ncbi:metallopeptidase family protein [Xanthobacter dioxanivorans]|uniref:Metallopeptidase family protein n=1 Tax=Xanthobacter dioxanivorans TaxID=2528964 RepID=A0A974SIU6_9HYPH|nr:metallopeptidase family protein [Xanthobacter dioxanivorans]QRG07105.1 metallopeptidase family protein [Xanthobacter dioxanivorans]
MSGNNGGERTNWRDLEAPTIAEFERLADEAFASLPASFRALCEGVVIRVEDFPTDDVLDALDAETPFDLLGLFQGIGRAQQGAVTHTGQMPNMVFLYRRPILDYWADNEETLGDLVTHVLVHEIGHHFGLSDDDMAEIEERAN